VAGVFGLRGELKVAANRIGEDALAAGLAVRVRLPDGTAQSLRIAAMREHQGRPLVRFDGIDDAAAAAALVGSTLWIDRGAVVLGAHEYLDEDLVGCMVVDAAGTRLGRVTGVEHFPAQDMLLVGPGRAMLPMVRAFVRSIDLAARKIVVDVPAGLIDPADAAEA
jgi:16S rRNA processing protein RimM